MGLMGGSLALALKGRFAKVTGFDIDPETRRIAEEQNIVEKATSNIEEALARADVICLATPVDNILQLLEELPVMIPSGKEVVVFDLGSTKTDIIKKMDGLPTNFHPIGGHPICGKEKLSIRNADRTLYYGAPFLLTRTKNSDEIAVRVVEEICAVLGADVKYLRPVEHDEILGIVSHVPYLLAGALVSATPESVKKYFGPGYRSASRLAGTDASMMGPVILSNQEPILANLERIVDELNTLIAVISDGDREELRQYLSNVNQIFNSLMDNQ